MSRSPSENTKDHQDSEDNDIDQYNTLPSFANLGDSHLHEGASLDKPYYEGKGAMLFVSFLLLIYLNMRMEL